MAISKDLLMRLARKFLREVKDKDPVAMERFEKGSGIDAQFVCLARCQNIIAKEHGYRRWVDIPND